ncbi:MAG: bifunctional metallophosphatase/5'-nucleotidase [Planctomycetota bacterium]
MRRTLALWLVLFAAPWARAQDVDIQILHASDLEGGLDALDRAPNFAAIVEALESEAAASSTRSIVLSAGDNYIPGPLYNAASDFSLRSTFQSFYQSLFGEAGLTNIREGSGRIDISIMNVIGFDASAVGNHEFDAGSDAFGSIIARDVRGGGLGDIRWLGAEFPYLSANLDFTGDGDLGPLFTDDLLESTAFATNRADLFENRPRIAPSTIIVRDGIKIGVVGATTPLVESISSPDGTSVKNPGAGSNDMAALAGILQPVIDAFPADVRMIVLVSHLQQFALERELVGLLNKVDLVIAGGSDKVLASAGDRLRAGDTASFDYPFVTTNKEGDTALLVSTNGEYSYVGRLVITMADDGTVKSVDDALSRPYVTDTTEVDGLYGADDPFADGTKGGAVKSLTDAVTTIVNERDGLVLGRTNVFIEGRRTQVRTQESTLGNLTADANLWVARRSDRKVLVSLKNGGGIRAPIGIVDGLSGELLPPPANPSAGKQSGDVSQLDIENSLRFNNGLTLITLTPAQLKQVLEHAVAESAPGATPGRFPQVGGLAFSFDPARAVNDRVRTVIVQDGRKRRVLVRNGQLKSTRPIRVVTLNFLVGGGDSYPYPEFLDADAAFANRVDLAQESAAPRTGRAIFAPDGTEQDALAEFLQRFHRNDRRSFNVVELGPELDERIQNLSVRDDSLANVRNSNPVRRAVRNLIRTILSLLFGSL